MLKTAALLLLLYISNVQSLESTYLEEIESLLNSDGILNDAIYKSVKDSCVLDQPYSSDNLLKKLKCILNDEPTLKRIYNNYLSDYSYSFLEFDPNRHLIFGDNILLIVKFNLEARSGLHSYEKGVNFFTEMTVSESENYTDCFSDPLIDPPSRSHKTPLDANTNWIPGWALPFLWFFGVNAEQENFDWRDKGVITEVEDQSNPLECGSCWTFGAVGAIEAYFAIEKGHLRKLSKQQLIDCQKKAKGCDGGHRSLAFSYAKDHGLSLESDYPYEAKNGDCRSNFIPIYGKIPAWREVKGDEHVLKYQLLKHPISVGVCANTNFGQYKKGIFEGCDSSCTKRNHAVLLVGFGIEKGNEYWTIKNSWGVNWGEKGYIRIKRNAGNMCLVAGNGYIAYHIHDDLKSNQ